MLRSAVLAVVIAVAAPAAAGAAPSPRAERPAIVLADGGHEPAFHDRADLADDDDLWAVFDGVVC